ncbi:hypothetical protein J6363_31120 [Burkholderia pseudomallei]|nr:hypothetical protein [Burkholderia pseudomallei]MBO7813194.1 hypothetical protein [Burkholderia pseudomallei]
MEIKLNTKNRTEIADGDIEWKEFFSSNGRKYEVGYLRHEENYEHKNTDSDINKKEDFGISVNWPVGDGSWKETDPEVQRRAAITRYSLYIYDGFYRYKLYFTNTKHYSYKFFDETGDSYSVNTYRAGDHFVRFDSGKPKIVYISGG